MVERKSVGCDVVAGRPSDGQFGPSCDHTLCAFGCSSSRPSPALPAPRSSAGRRDRLSPRPITASSNLWSRNRGADSRPTAGGWRTASTGRTARTSFAAGTGRGRRDQVHSVWLSSGVLRRLALGGLRHRLLGVAGREAAPAEEADPSQARHSRAGLGHHGHGRWHRDLCLQRQRQPSGHEALRARAQGSP